MLLIDIMGHGSHLYADVWEMNEDVSKRMSDATKGAAVLLCSPGTDILIEECIEYSTFRLRARVWKKVGLKSYPYILIEMLKSEMLKSTIKINH